ncbi:hypothetical protein HN385_05780 [archaeon]|mgnify:CR=1 FL=1|jgi:uncharacterized protein (UPF0332 family)/predicted nucleotidyltransferase|nr:hypothetical protein [archaeon]MBT3450396.1 hypothetical protein [archaeon]MBT6868626.1 hypothetical protein [archaeon]MBT7193407.1 hypothetical protein [archaeon]MBT7381423.1 hypothetical protein [archaeon]
MEFKIGKKVNENVNLYPTEDLKIANHFTNKLSKELGNFLAASVLFGSGARKQSTNVSDIDILIIGDDLEFKMTREFVETYRIIIENLIAKTSIRLHITSMTLSSFWDYARAGDPVVTNILRDGVSLYDLGFFKPLQSLMKNGKIRPSEESVWRYFSRAPRTLTNSRWHLLQATLDLYWAVIDSAHAALMKHKQIPPSPDHAAEMLNKVFVKNRLLEPKYVETMNRFYKISKMITHREIKEIKGQEYELYYKEAADFVMRMKKLIYRGDSH